MTAKLFAAAILFALVNSASASMAIMTLPMPAVPEAGSTFALMALALTSVAALRYKLKK
jgi:hypothetical protein